MKRTPSAEAAQLGEPSYVWRSGQERRLQLIRKYVPLEGRWILDVGCGIGTYCRRFRDYSPHGVAMTKQVLWASLEVGSLAAAIDLENRNQLLVRLTTNNLQEAITARRDGRKPRYED